MKKIVSLILAISFVLSIATSASAFNIKPINSEHDGYISSELEKNIVSESTTENVICNEITVTEYEVSETDLIWFSMSKEEILKRIKNSPKETSHPASGDITVEKVVMDYYETYGVMPAANELITYKSDKMESGALGVKWSVEVKFTLGQRANGTYYFDSISSSTISIHKNYLLIALWSDYVLVSTSNKTCSIIDNASKIKVGANFNFTVCPSGTTSPYTYSEYHYTEIPISYVTK